MNKWQVINLVDSKRLSFDDYYQFLDWLYDNGFHIVKECDELVKSKFIEEWEKFTEVVLEGKDAIQKNTVAILELAQLIDKHKADKEE